MPMKPHKDESQSEFMARCVPEMIGSGDDKRPQEQAVAICMDIWRGEHGGKKPKALESSVPAPDEDENEDDFLNRCVNEVFDENPDADDDEVEQACELAWQESRAARQRPRDPLLHKTHSGTVNGFEFTLSDETPDRMGDIIASDGWDITNFKRNPIALFNHSPSAPLGTWKDLRIENGALRGRLEFAPKGISPRIDEIRALVEHGILQAVSVGFRPLESKPRKSSEPGNMWPGEHFIRQELIETSLVSVPANPNALAVAKSLNISPATLDVVFAKHGNRDGGVRRRDFTGKHADMSRSNGKGSAMTTLAQRISDLQTQIANKQAELDVHLEKMDDSNVSDTDMEKTTLLNAQIVQLQKQHAALVESEKVLGQTAETADGSSLDQRRRSLIVASVEHRDTSIGAPIIVKHSKKDWQPLDYLVHAGTAVLAAKLWGMTPDQARQKIYGEDEATKVVFDWTQRAASAPAMTTVTGWAQELVQQVYADFMSLLMPKSVFPRLSGKGLSLSFGRAGKILLPTRSRTPTIAGSFVGEGMPIPVRQGAFTSQTFVPKKMAVITVWTREMSEHSVPAIEGVLRDAIQEDTAVALDSVLLDANPATTIRPAGILNGVAATGATAGGGIGAIVGDLKALVGALVTSTYGNIRNPTWLMNPAELLSASLATAANTGIFPFKDEIARGTLANIPIIDSATVPAKTVILQDAADFVTMQGDNMRFELSDQATLHMEDTNPAELVSGSPGTVASPQRSLFQTDSIALRMLFPLNWAIRRGGTVAWTQNVTW